jgi:hypothetical protein
MTKKELSIAQKSFLFNLYKLESIVDAYIYLEAQQFLFSYVTTRYRYYIDANDGLRLSDDVNIMESEKKERLIFINNLYKFKLPEILIIQDSILTKIIIDLYAIFDKEKEDQKRDTLSLKKSIPDKADLKSRIDELRDKMYLLRNKYIGHSDYEINLSGFNWSKAKERFLLLEALVDFSKEIGDDLLSTIKLFQDIHKIIFDSSLVGLNPLHKLHFIDESYVEEFIEQELKSMGILGNFRKEKRFKDLIKNVQDIKEYLKYLMY